MIFRVTACLFALMLVSGGAVQAKSYRHVESAAADRALIQAELAAVQAAEPTHGEVRVLKRVIHSGRVVEESVHFSRALSSEDLLRVAEIVQQIRSNPEYIRRTGGHRRVGRRISYSAPALFLTVGGVCREVEVWSLHATGGESARCLLEEKLITELRALVNGYVPAKFRM